MSGFVIAAGLLFAVASLGTRHESGAILFVGGVAMVVGGVVGALL